MKNSSLLSAVLAAAIMALSLIPSSAHAQTVGVILTHGDYDHERIQEALEYHLKTEGYLDKIKFITQRPYPDPIAFSNAARKLIAAEVDVIITYGASPTLAVLREKPTIPVLYAGIYEPIAAEIKSKWAAGVCTKLNLSSLIRYLRASTQLNVVGVVYHSLESDSKYQLDELSQMASKYGITVKPIDLKFKGNLTELLDQSGASAFIITSSLMANSSLPTILHVAAANKIPTASLVSNSDVAAMITLTAEPEDQGDHLAHLLIDVIKGRQVQSLSNYCARKVELVYNVKEANRMGLKISMDLITEATKLINK